MSKKLIKVLPVALLVVALMWLWPRLTGSAPGTIPLPYIMPKPKVTLVLEAPILIAGDRMAARFALFKEFLSEALSVGLSKPLKIQSIATPGEGLHRTLWHLSTLDKWPQVLIYQGASEELAESKFQTNQIPAIRGNFNLSKSDTVLTLLMLWPSLSRFIYEPINRVRLGDTPAPPLPLKDLEVQARSELTYLLYEVELRQLVGLAQEHQTLLILMTSPVNIDVPPRKTCENATAASIDQEVRAIRKLIVSQDYKSAYERSKALAQNTLANAEVLYLHGQIAYRNNLRAEALQYLKRAAAFDCQGWRSNEAFNNIIRRVAREQNVTLFDFDRMMDDNWNKNVTFFDEIYAQDIYYNQSAQALALMLRRVLKL